MSEAVLDTTDIRRWKRRESRKRLPLDWEIRIPVDWGIHRLKEVADARPSNVDKKSQEDERQVRLCNYVDVYKNDRITEDIEFMQATASESQIEQFGIQAGDVIITKDSEAWDDIAVPAYVPETLENLVCGYHLTLIRPNESVLDGSYLARCIQAEGLADQFRVLANGITRYGIGTQGIRCAVIPVPPLSEQRAIAAFLDRETARIDALVAKKQRLIELLEEKRQAIISQAVTQGLDPDTKDLDSKIGWIDDVPASWKFIPMKHLCESLQTGPFGSLLHVEDYVRNGNPLVNPSHLRNGRIEPDADIAVNDETKERLVRFHLREGDVVFARRGELGRSAVVTKEEAGWITGTGSLRVRPASNLLLADYLQHIASTQGFRDGLMLQSVGTTMDNLNESILGSCKIPCPPLEIQRMIVNQIFMVSERLNLARSRIQTTIDLLLEHRSALISAAVTGQIDVRDEVPLDD